MQVAAKPSPLPAIPRTWRSLLTGRWHRSSWVVAALVLLLLAFCNVPGQLVVVPNDPEGVALGQDHQFEHGWPWTWAARYGETWTSEPRLRANVNCWTFWADEPEFGWSILAWNLGVAIVVTVVAGSTFELWCRARSRLWQLHLRDFFAVFLLLSLVGAWYAAAQRRYAHERRILGPPFVEGARSLDPRAPTHGINWYATTHGGITWLRRLAGDRHFQFLDRVISVEVEPAGLTWAAQLPAVGAVEVVGDVTTDELSQLVKLPQLEYLSVTRATFGAPIPRTAPTLTMPRLPHVHELKVDRIHCDGLINLPALQGIQFCSQPVDEEHFRQLAGLPNLEFVHFHQCALSNRGLSNLKGSRKLSELSFHFVKLSKDHFQQLQQIEQLMDLEFFGCELEHAGQLQRLKSLPRLETLYLTGTNVDDESLRHLTHLPNLQYLDLAGTEVTSKAIPHLAAMKQLRDLRLDGSKFHRDGRAHLQAALPACKLEFMTTPFPVYAPVPELNATGQ